MHRTFAITSSPLAVGDLGAHLALAHSPQSARVLRRPPTSLVTGRNRLVASGRLHATAGLAARVGGPR
jgi:hypothetical protein